jgi:hypothetical protein
VWYAACVEWPERQKEGFALAAAARGDRGAARALLGLSPASTGPVAALSQRLGTSDASARRRWVRAVLDSRVANLEIGAAQGARPARALALLAASVDKQLGRAFLAGAALPRPGYVAEPRLIALLQRLAARPVPDRSAAAQRRRGATDGDAWPA